MKVTVMSCLQIALVRVPLLAWPLEHRNLALQMELSLGIHRAPPIQTAGQLTDDFDFN